MKLCSICDKKIEGTWCKNCHRFVKIYEISDGIHFNESHDPVNDAGCTYHTFEEARSTVQKAVTGRNTSKVQHGSAMRTVVQKRAAAGKGKTNKKVKLVILGVVIYMVIAFTSSLIPALTDLAESFQEMFTYEDDYDYEYGASEDPLYESDAVIALEGLSPVSVEIEEEEEYSYQYYDPDEIKTLGIRCDSQHFSMTADDIDAVIGKLLDEEWSYEDVTGEENNYKGQYKTYAWTSFNTYRYYEQPDNLLIDVCFDTATNELHDMQCYTKESEAYTSFYYGVAEAFDAEIWAEMGEAQFTKVLLAATEIMETSTEIYSSDKVRIIVYAEEHGAVVQFYPPYEE